jgi:hypothetical protein
LLSPARQGIENAEQLKPRRGSEPKGTEGMSPHGGHAMSNAFVVVVWAVGMAIAIFKKDELAGRKRR